MYLDTNADGVNTPGDRIPFSEGGEFTNVDIWLDTTTNRDGTAATCASSGEPLSISSYEICLSAVGGSVDWGTFTNHTPFSTSFGAQENVTTYYNGFIGGTLPPGRYLLATIQVAWRFSAPDTPDSLEIVSASPFLPGARTAFQSVCHGQNGDGFLRLGTDWFDTAGLPVGQIDHYPIFSTPPLDMVVPVGGIATQAVEAADPDGAPTSITLDTGPSYLTAETLAQAPGGVIVRLRAAPALADLGGTYAVLSASDGSFTVSETLNITVTPAVGPARSIDFETPSLGALVSQVIDPYVDPITAVEFHALPSGSFAGVVGLVKNSATGCADPSDGNQRLGTAPTGSDQIGRAGHPIEARFPTPLEPPASVSVEIKTLNLAFVQLQLFDPAGNEVGIGHEIMLPALTNCGTFLPPAVRTFTATSTRPVAYAQVRVPNGYVFTIDNFQFSESALAGAPIVVAPASVAGVEGTAMSVPVSASDPDGEAIASLTADLSGLPLGHAAVFTTNPSNTSGTFTWTPGFMDAGTYTVTFTASNSASGSATTRLTVADLNRAPIANAGGPYFGVSASPVQLDGSGSSDPDGDVLTYTWNFGDGATGTSPAPMHAYSAAGTYNVTLRVMDFGGLYDDDATTATIRNQISVVLLLKKGKSTLNVDTDGLLKLAIEEVEVPYTDVLVGTLRLSTDFPNPGTVAECAADPKRSRIGDTDGNGVPDLEVGFSGFCLRNLFQNAPNDATVNLIITGQFQGPSGTTPLRGVTVITIKRDENNAPLLAEVTPNPFNPQAKLSFVTVRPGNASIQVFDLHGHLVRTLMPQQHLMPGIHEVTIDGLNDQGLRLSSGVYFYRVCSADGILKGALAVLK